MGSSNDWSNSSSILITPATSLSSSMMVDVVVKIPSVVTFPPLAVVVKTLLTMVVRRFLIVVGCIVDVVVVVADVEVVGFADDDAVEALVVAGVVSVVRTDSDVEGVVSFVVVTVLYGVVVSEI